MNLAIPDIRTLEIHLPNFGYLTTSCQRSSGLGGRDDLGVSLLSQAIHDAAGLGYNFLSIAGEQSLFHPGLKDLCGRAHQMRMLTTISTRCGLLSARRLKALVPTVDLLGIRYEAGMARNLEPVRRSGIPFALVYHLTAANMGELESTAAFAVSHGAAMLHVRPAEGLSDHSMATVWMIIECLRDIHRGELAVQLEVLNRYNLTLGDGDLADWKAGVAQDDRFLGELISPLVVEEDGAVVPLRTGFPRSLALGNLHQATLAEMAAAWIHKGASDFCDLYGSVLQNVRREGSAFGDLHQLLAEGAGRNGGASFSAAG
jgi:hypothetical protein